MQGDVEVHRHTSLIKASDLQGMLTCQPRAPSAYYHTCCEYLPLSSYTSYSASTQRRPGPNLTTLNLVLFPSSSSRHSTFGPFKQSIVHSTSPFISFSDACSHCSGEGMWLLHSHCPHQHTKEVGTMGIRTNWSTSRSGSALHAMTSSDIADRALPAGSRRTSAFVSWTPYG